MATGLAPCSCSLLKSFEGLRLRSVRPLQTKLSSPVTQRGQLQVRNARVGNVELPNQKRIEYSLQYIYGIGHPTAIQILSDTGIENKRTRELSEEELTQLREEVDKYSIEGDLRRFNNLNIKRLQDIGCRRGRRHTARLPVRGQNTKNNARTRKGKAMAIAGKKKATK